MIGNRFKQLPENPALSIFFTAGYPRLNDTMPIITALQASGVDMVEVGFPFSDPVADGPTIQESNLVALANGMNIKLLFEQLSKLRSGSITMPVLLMGYLNPVERYGCERFFEEAARCGIDALICPLMNTLRVIGRSLREIAFSPYSLLLRVRRMSVSGNWMPRIQRFST